MTIIKVSDGKYINLDRVTYIEPKRGGRVIVHFAVAGDIVPSCILKLDEQETMNLIRWLDTHAQHP